MHRVKGGKRPDTFADESEARLRLTERVFARLVEATGNPAPPNARLVAAAEEYKWVRREQPELKW